MEKTTDLKEEIEEKLRKDNLIFFSIGDETIDKWLEEANKKIIRSYQKGKEQALLSQKEEFEKMIDKFANWVKKMKNEQGDESCYNNFWAIEEKAKEMTSSHTLKGGVS
jgi:predicted AlkP superfamily phosphohydrolase/phosphomutase